MSPRRPNAPEPNFLRLVTDEDLSTLVLSAHALRRFVERLQPAIPQADRIAREMAWLEDLGEGSRTDPQQAQLATCRDWMAAHVRPHVIDVIRCEGFWATERPQFSLSLTSSDQLLQVGRMCLFPAVTGEHGQLVLTTCTNGRDITWDTALDRGYTLMPKPYTGYTPPLLWPPSWPTIALRAWRARSAHRGLLAAFRAEHAQAIEHTRRQNDRRQNDTQDAQRHWLQERDRAAEAFRKRHRSSPTHR